MNQEKEKTKNLIQVDGGNLFFPGQRARGGVTENDKKQAQVLARSMDYLKVDVINIGVQDLAAGMEFLVNQLGRPEGEEPLPLISANLVWNRTGERPAPSFKVIPIAGLQVAFVGLISGGEKIEDPEVKIEDPIARAGELAPRLREKCDLVVVLFAGDQAEASRLAREVKGIDIIVISGRQQMRRDRPLAVEDTILIQAGGRGMYLGRLDLVVRPEGGEQVPESQKVELQKRLELLEAQQTILTGVIQREPEINAFYRSTHSEIELVRQHLVNANSRLTTQNLIVSVDLELPEDETVAGWVKEIGGEPKK